MNSYFDLPKATEAAIKFIHKEGGSINIMKLIKLVYLLDRASIETRGMPVVGGIYFSMRNGPVTSELLDLINSGSLADENDPRWEEHISDRANHRIALREDCLPVQEFLSDFELELLDHVYEQHGAKNEWQIRDWCHERCAEWHPLRDGRANISLESIAEAVGRDEHEISRLREEAEETNLLAAAFAR